VTLYYLLTDPRKVTLLGTVMVTRRDSLKARANMITTDLRRHTYTLLKICPHGKRVVSYEGMVMEWRLDDAKALSPILVTVVVRHTLAIL
jgi:hypothetical protein